MEHHIDPKEWACTDDAPTNNGWGHDIWPEPREEKDDEDIQDVNEEE